MSSNNCAGCGQFAGKNHVCPRRSGILYAEMKEKSLDRREASIADRVRQAKAEETAARVSRAQEHIVSTDQQEPQLPSFGPEGTEVPVHGDTRLEPSGLTVTARKSEWGSLRWTLPNGKAHSETGPATFQDDEVTYQINGKFHRTDGPAVITRHVEEWHQNGQLHREDGPAKTWSDGTQAWYSRGELHREDGPAVIRADGTSEYWLHGREVNGLPYNEIVGNWLERWSRRREAKREAKYRKKMGYSE